MFHRDRKVGSSSVREKGLVMEAEDALRLAWEADHDGRPRLRDALMTLAVADSQPGDAWVDRCRARLIADRPDHFLSRFPTVGSALEDSRVVEARERLRAKYPPPKIRWLLLRAAASRGPFLGRVESLEALVDDLAGPPAEVVLENVRMDLPQPSRGPIQLQRASRPLAFALALPSAVPTGLEIPKRPAPRFGGDWSESINEPPIEDFGTYYLTVLLAIAFLMGTLQESDGKSRG
jgi:hypothetical protein